MKKPEEEEGKEKEEEGTPPTKKACSLKKKMAFHVKKEKFNSLHHLSSVTAVKCASFHYCARSP